MSKHTRISRVIGLVAAVVGATPAFGTFHLMQIEQVIGGVNGDITAQAIQLRMRSAGQVFVSSAQVCVEDAVGANPILLIDMTTDVLNGSAGSRVLIASSSFLTQTGPTTVPDFVMTNLIPPSYLAAGTLTFRQDGGTPCTGTIYWRLSWGGAGYTGSGSVTAVPIGNDDNGNANPPFAGALPSTSLQALQFTGTATATSTNNAAQYAVTVGAAVFTNNANTNFTVTGPTPTGACCDDNTGTCTNNVTQSTCEGDGRRYGGNSVACVDIDPPCVPPPPPPIQIALELIAGGSQAAAGPTLASPLGIIDAGDGTGRLFIHDQAGQIRVIDAGGNLLPDPFLDISALLSPLGIDFGGGIVYDERGLLGLAFHPNYANNGKFYVRYSKPRTSTGSEPCDTLLQAQPPRCHEEVLAQYTVLGNPLTSNTADATSEVILFRWDKPQFNHNAGHIEFGPDGFLYISTGDGGGANDGLADGDPPGSAPTHGPFGNGQNIETALGKMIRIDVDGTDGPGGLYGIPPTNPFVGVPGLDEIYAYGFRNPFRFSFDDDLGGDNSLYVADVGQDIYEEVDKVVNGGNYGWVIREGLHCFDPFNPSTPPASCSTTGAMGEPLIDPISEYSHADGGLAVVGGYLYRGAAYPQLQGKYIYGNFSNDFGPTGRLYYFDLTGPDAFVRREFFLVPSGAPFGQFLKGLGRDADGEIYVTASDVLGPSGTTGVIYKIVPPPNDIIWDPTANPIPWPNANPLATTRSLRFTVTGLAGPSKPEAIKVTMVDLQHPKPANLAAQAPPNFTTFDTRVNGVCNGGSLAGHHCDIDADCPSSTCGSLAACTAVGEANSCARWVGKPGTFLESQDAGTSGGTYIAARLQCTPFYHDWKLEGLITVVGAEIVPSSEYSVQTYGASCLGTEDTCTAVSAPVTMYTRRSGDTAPNFNPPATTGQPDALDVAAVVNKLKNLPGALVKAIVQLQPNLPELNANVNALDIVAVVDAVRGLKYGFSGPCTCPSAVTCGGACGTGCPSPNMCVKTCTGGSNAGDPCINNTHCPGGGTCGTPLCRDRCGRCKP